MLAAKASLAIRVDALGEDGNVAIGIDSRAKLERQMKFMEEGYVSLASKIVVCKSFFARRNIIPDSHGSPDGD